MTKDEMKFFSDTLKTLNERIEIIYSKVNKHKLAVFTNQELMDCFNVSSATLKKWRDEGFLGYSQINSIYLYSENDIEKFLNSTHFEAYAVEIYKS